MKFNKKQRIGIITLIGVIVFIQFLIMNFNTIDNSSISKETIDRVEYYNHLFDSIKQIKPNDQRKYFKFNPNRLSYNSWSYFGLSTAQLYTLDSFRLKSEFTSKIQVKQVLKLNDSIYGIIDSLMYLPKVYKSKYASQDKEIKYSNFNPNMYSISEWENLGFSEKQAEIIFNYIKVRGGIESKEELKEIFVINDKKYKELEEFVMLPKVKKEVVHLTLNSATIDDFKDIDGIGDVYSKIIVDYRDRLGGFKYYYQLNEISIVDSSMYQKIKKKFALSKDFTVKKININTATFEELNNHPYISWRLANSIVDFRTNFRDFKTVDEIKNIEVISDAYFNKIKLYLTLE